MPEHGSSKSHSSVGESHSHSHGSTPGSSSHPIGSFPSDSSSNSKSSSKGHSSSHSSSTNPPCDCDSLPTCLKVRDDGGCYGNIMLMKGAGCTYGDGSGTSYFYDAISGGWVLTTNSGAYWEGTRAGCNPVGMCTRIGGRCADATAFVDPC